MFTLLEANAGVKLGTKKAKLEGIKKEADIRRHFSNIGKNQLIAAVKNKYKNPEKQRSEIAKINEFFKDDMRKLDQWEQRAIKRIKGAGKKENFGKGLMGKVKKYGNEVKGVVTKTIEKIPGKTPAAIGGSLLIAAVAAATYHRYKKLEDERLKYLKGVLQKRIDQKLEKYS